MNLPFFAVKAYVPGGVQNQAEKNSKNAFRPVPAQKFTIPVLFDYRRIFCYHRGELIWP